MDRDLPRGWVLPDVAIYELAETRPQNRDELSRLAAVPRGTAQHAADAILAAIADARGEDGVHDAGEGGRPGPEQLRRQKLLQKQLTALASELGIQPEVLATRRELAALARGSRESILLTGWRRTVVGEPLIAALQEGTVPFKGDVHL
jgi:ribonuclease D